MKLLLNPKTLSFTFEIPSMPATTGVQKILGFSRGWHQWNSVRLGIRKENDYCVLYSYVYKNGARFINRIGKVNIGDTVNCLLGWNNTIFISANGMVKILKAPLISNPISYLLMPYFETDAPENKRETFYVNIWDVKCNEREVEL